MWQSGSKVGGSPWRGEASMARGDATWGRRQKHWDPCWDPKTGLNQQERGIAGGAASLPTRGWHKSEYLTALGAQLNKHPISC
ncbi:hypothetical protein SISNIDRAFT_458564 [Sistotremastrum niveocremeum HHB9708]|uniref:Uncharacterized protein n=1 Tax=Sistotremastrum niveocremeum HHB9708 TaxID=1314777 RepID=A0A164QG53_9AGAM|nr:hypothetical protein SISNIDRAFT_458564 [Sistotremastrum niveocremeum HHB9708]